MDFLLSATLVRFDAWFFFANLAFLFVASVSYVVEKLFWLFRVVSPVRAAQTAKENGKAPPSSEAPSENPPAISDSVRTDEVSEAPLPTSDDRQQASEIAKLAKTKIARGEFTEAKAKIIEGLTYDKFDKELNCLLASLYERDKDFKKAELVYKDLIVVHDTDSEIYMKLGFALSMQTKYEIAFEIYKKLHAITGGSDEAVEMLANLAYQLERYEDARNSAKEYLKKHPRNVEMLNLLASSQANLGEREAALETLEKLRVIDPYNSKIREFAEKISLEIELEGNFGKTPSA